VFLHQILARVVEQTSERNALWRSLQGPHAFSGIDRAAFDDVVDHLLQGILDTVDHMLIFGDEESASSAGLLTSTRSPETPASVVKNRNGRVIRMLETTFVRQMKDRSSPSYSRQYVDRRGKWTSTGTW